MLNYPVELLLADRLSRKYNEGVMPLYLSYPVSGFWKSAVSDDDYMTGLRKENHPFLYFHFPYCKELCHYCACFSIKWKSDHELDRYVAGLEKEIALKLENRESLKISEMHWGGGTPTCMTCHQIERVFTAIEKNCVLDKSSDRGFSVEAFPDPSVLTDEKLRLLWDLGFNEISLGIQDFDVRVLHAIHRKTDQASVLKLIETARAIGFRIHIDLCYGLPLQGVNEFEKTIKSLIPLSPDRFAFFTYAHHPTLFPNQRKIPLSSIPNGFTRLLMAGTGDTIMRSHGYCKVGYDHYVRPDNNLFEQASKEQVFRDFMGYSVEQRHSVVGFGNAAISYMDHTYSQNLSNVDAYCETVKTGRIPLEKNSGHCLSEDDIIRQSIIQKSLLTDLCLDIKKIEKQFFIQFDSYFSDELEKLAVYIDDGLLTMTDNDVFRVTETGVFFLRHMAHVFDNYY